MQVGRQIPGEGKGARFKGYSSTAACVQHLVRTEGLLGLTRGVGATMLRETPGNAIFFLRRAGLSAQQGHDRTWATRLSCQGWMLQSDIVAHGEML